MTMNVNSQDQGAEQQLRELRMRYTRERDSRNAELPNDAQDLPFISEHVRSILARIFGRRHVHSIFWLFVLILLLIFIRMIFGSPLAYLGRLPTDISLQGPNWQFYAPVGTCILLSCLFSAMSSLMGSAFQRPPQAPMSHRSDIPAPRGGFEFHGSVLFCAIQ